MNNRIANDIAGKGYFPYSAPKLVYFSTHDTTLGSVLTFLSKVFGTQKYYTPFASCLYFELSRPDDGVTNPSTLTPSSYTLDIIYNDIPLASMPFPKFQSGLSSNIWSDDTLSYNCSVSLLTYYGFKNATITLGVLLGVCFVLLIIIIIMCCSRGKGQPEEHDHTKVKAEETKV